MCVYPYDLHPDKNISSTSEGPFSPFEEITPLLRQLLILLLLLLIAFFFGTDVNGIK